MNALTGIENLIKQPGILQCPYWCAYYDRVTDKNRIRDNYHIEDCKIEQSEKLLRQLISDLETSGCNLVIWFSENPKPNKGGYTIPFYLPGHNNYSQNGINGNNGYVSREEMNGLQQNAIAKALEDFKLQLELKERNQEISELRQQIKEMEPRTMDRILGRMDFIFTPAVMGEIVKKVFNVEVPAVSGNTTNDNIGETVDAEAQKIAEDSLMYLAEQEPDLPVLLMKLAKLRREDPEKFKMAKSML